ncbi:GntR family transcriptional regulator [Actinomycetospora chlora]|uniref:GntR family transcriptional regulator n=1 Tax=Actinomycetospora chlora TaxID=663608 RepID=A0ABP9B0U1_9PSEU
MTRATERAVVGLREAILGGEFAGGTRLGEVELAERLGVSRTPVREALSRLAVEGLVDLSPHRGARVATWTAADLDAVFEVRLALEPRATARAATRAGPDDLAELDRLAHAMDRAGRPGPAQDLDELVEQNRDFHARLVTVSDQAALATALAGVVHTPVVLRNFHAYDADSLARSLAHHHEVVAALRARDPDWAASVMRSHIGNARAALLGPRPLEEAR